MISGIVPDLGRQPMGAKGISFRSGSSLLGNPGLGVTRWHMLSLPEIGAATGSPPTVPACQFIINIPANGSFVLGPAPNGLADTASDSQLWRAGRNQRGVASVDMQIWNSWVSGVAATMVASGNCSALIAGEYNTASGTDSAVVAGRQNTASGAQSFIGGSILCTASASPSFAFGSSLTASGVGSFIVGGNGSATRNCQFAVGAINRTAGTAFAWQTSTITLSGLTSNATPQTLLNGGVFNSTTRLTVASGTVMACEFEITGSKSDGSGVAKYSRKAVFKNVGGTTTLVNAVETIGTDYEDNAACDVAITADDANDAVQVNVTGIAAETWRWVCTVRFHDFSYGV